MLDIIQSLLPVFLLIALGAGLRRAAFLPEAFWPPLERLVYFVLFPPLLFHTIVTAELDRGEALRLASAFLLAVTGMALILFALRPLLPMPGPAYSSVYQGAIRWNSYVALGIIAALMGPSGIALSAVAFAAMVPAVNILSVTVISRYAADRPASVGAILLSLAANPLIIACVLGVAAAAFRLPVPAVLLTSFRLLGDATVALGLIAVGAALDFGRLRASGLALAVTGTLKLAVMPLLVWLACLALGIKGEARAVALVCAAVPPATSAYILARQLGGDAPLMANLITVLTLLSALTMPVVVALAR